MMGKSVTTDVKDENGSWAVQLTFEIGADILLSLLTIYFVLNRIALK